MTKEEEIAKNLELIQSENESPARILTKETKILKGVKTDDRVQDILGDGYVPRQDYSWRSARELWVKSTEDERRGMLCHMVLNDGIVLHNKIGLRTVADYFGIAIDDLKPYMDVVRFADAQRVLHIGRYQLARTKSGAEKDISALFNMTKQFAYQVNDPAYDDVASVTTTPPAIIINPVKADNKELKEDLEKKLKAAGVNVDFSKLN